MDLDLDYSNSAFIPDAEAYPDRWAEAATDWRSRETAVGRARLNIAYGARARERFDLFYPGGRPRGLAVFVHGGYWMRFDRSDWSHFAEGATSAGWAMSLPSYSLAPEARISEMTVQIARAIEAAADAVPGPVVLCGHSAGGHLVARMAVEGGPLSREVAARLSHVVPISPLGDLRPLLQTTMNETLRIDAVEAEAESPVRLMRDPTIPVSVWVGAEERPAFLEQARALSETWDVPLHVAPHRHHFDVIDHLRDPLSAMMQDLLRVQTPPG